MRKKLFLMIMAAAIVLAAAPVVALQTGTWDCMGYTISVTPDDPNNPTAGGTLTITKSDDYADVVIEGTYVKEDGRRPATVVHVWGTIVTQDAAMDVDRTFTFQPGPQKTVWRTVLSWIEGVIAA